MPETPETVSQQGQEENQGRDSIPAARPDLIVGIGVAAGDLGDLGKPGALSLLLGALPGQSGLGFVVVQQSDAWGEQLMLTRLRGATSMPVHSADDGMAVAPDHVYVVPSDCIVTFASGRMQVLPIRDEQVRRGRMDRFFGSLAEDAGARVVGVVLAGAGREAIGGLKAIKANGGLILGQAADLTSDLTSGLAPDLAPGDRSSTSVPWGGLLDHGLLDDVLPVADIPARIAAHAAHAARMPADLARMPEDGGAERDLASEQRMHLASIWRVLQSQVGHDFSRYKPSAMLRRIERRMHVLCMETLGDYVRHLARDEREVGLLYRDLLIGVTCFFRDPDAFLALEQRVIPRLFEQPSGDDQIRVWVPGCATGEEAYSIAMLLREQQDLVQAWPRIQVFATDLDAHALDIARRGRYPRSQMSNIAPERVRRFFRQERGEYEIVPELREMCLFSTHNLLHDPPFGRLDLVSCRNLLIYLDRDTQKLLVPLFHYALRHGGYLFLGPTEHLAAHPELFEELEGAPRIFRRQPSVRRSSVPLLRAQRGASQRAGGLASEQPGDRAGADDAGQPLMSRLVERIVLDEYACPAVTVNERFDIVYAVGPTSRYLSLPAGQPQLNLMQMAKRGLRMELYTALHQALDTDATVARDAAVELGGERVQMRILVQPLSRLGGPAGLYLVILQERAPAQGARSLESAFAGPDPVIRRLEADLEDTRQHFDVEVLARESQNEELRGSNEELLSLNEELQSVNHDLQSSKEELQSANEELAAVNAELARRLDELGRVNGDLLNLFQSTHVPTIFLSHELRIVRFTAAAREVFRLIDSDVGRSIEDITRRFRDVDLESVCQRVLRTLDRQILEVVRPSDETHFIMRISPYRTVQDTIDGVVLTFSDVTPIKRAEDAVRRSETRYRSLVEATASVVWTAGADGRFTHPQPRFEDYTGLPFHAPGHPRPPGWLGDQLVGHRDFGWLDAIHPNDRERLALQWSAAVRDGGEFQGAGRIYHAASQGYRFFEVRAVAIRDSRGAIEEWVGTITDVHDRRSTEVALSESEARLELAIEATELGIFDFDRRAGRTRSNQNNRRIHGLALDREPTSDEFLSCLHEEDRDLVRHARFRACDPRGDGRYEVQYRVRWADGTIHWLAAKARAHFQAKGGKLRVRRLIGTVQDITESRRVQGELERRAAQQAAVSELGMQALMNVELQQVFDAAVELVAGTLGVPLAKVLESRRDRGYLLLRAGVGWREGLVGKTILPAGSASQAGYTLEVEQPVVVDDLAADTRFDQPPLLIEHGVVSGMSVIIGGQDGPPWGVLSVHGPTRQTFTLDDVNFLQAIANILASAIERARVHGELREAKLAAESANAAKDRFLAVLSHEMRTPLTPVLAAASDLEMDPELPERVRDSMRVIRRNVELEARLLDDLLDLTRIGRGKLKLEPRAVSVRELMEQVVQICAAETENKRLTVRLDMGDRDWHVLADPARTMQVLWNLLNNAVKYTPRGGRIDVRCAPAGAKMVRIEIRDTGVGMEPELLARIFDAFEQGEGLSDERGRPAAQRAGLGLGLSIARALVEGHGGRIGAESAGPGRGSTFRIELPLARGDTGAPAGGGPAGVQPATGRRVLRVLLIEDHEDSAEILSRLLARDGAEVRVARCGQDALAAVADERFDLVISDIGLPDIPGYELLPRLLAQQPALRGIALSGFGMDEDVARCREAGFRKHLTKPVDFQKLRGIIRGITED